MCPGQVLPPRIGLESTGQVRTNGYLGKIEAEMDKAGRVEQILGLAANPITSIDRLVSELAVSPAINAGMVIDSLASSLLGSGNAALCDVADSLRQTSQRVQSGDLAPLETMLVSQANALQAIFTGYAVKAQAQTNLRNMESMMNLALKAQAQSRATISALVDLKYPRQATFVKQANIANGAQQVNNATGSSARKKNPPSPNKLSRPDHELRQDARAPRLTVKESESLEALGKVDRAANRRR